MGKICVVRCIHEEDGKAWIQMSKKTHTNPLSRKEIEMLRKNPYVATVTANTVRFTEAFKELAYEKKCQGISVAETMRQCGIDPEILGASRVEGFSYTLNKKAKQKNGFADAISLVLASVLHRKLLLFKRLLNADASYCLLRLFIGITGLSHQ